MKKYIILTYLLAVTLLSHAQNNFNPSAGITIPKDYFTEIPYENMNGKLIISVEVNGKPYRFVFDTGMSITMVNKKILDDLNHSTFSVLSIDQSGKKDSLLVNKLNHIRIGDTDFGEVPVVTVDFDENPLIKCFNVDGYLGSNLFAHMAIRISSTEKTITLTDNSSTLQLNKEQSSELLFPSEENRLPFIKIRFFDSDDDYVIEPVQLDAGANHLYRLQLDHLTTLHEQGVVQDIVKSAGSSSIGLFGNAEVEDMYLVKIPKMEINGATLNGLQVETIENQYSSIGSSLFDYGTVTFDYINSLFYFEPFNEVIDVNEKLFPVSPTVSDGKLVVGVIWDASLENQISIGDQIVSIDDIDYTNLEVCELMVKGVEFKDKNRITLGIKNRQGNIKQITIERR